MQKYDHSVLRLATSFNSTDDDVLLDIWVPENALGRINAKELSLLLKELISEYNRNVLTRAEEISKEMLYNLENCSSTNQETDQTKPEVPAESEFQFDSVFSSFYGDKEKVFEQ